MSHPAAMGPRVEGGPSGRRKMDASKSAFAKRMMEKPIPEGMNPDPNYRIFLDPPELIQIAFGGREWFLETGSVKAHRIGLFKGIGWELDQSVAKQSDTGITGVKITHRPNTEPMVFDMVFVGREVPEDHLDGYSERVIATRAGLRAEQLKPAYAEVIGDHSI